MTPLSTLVVLLLVKLMPSSAQDVRAVDDYIYDPAPVAGIGVGERVPQRAEPGRHNMNQGQVKPEVLPRTSSLDRPVISKETEETISYVEDFLAGRVNPSKDSPRSGSESISRNPPRSVASVDYSRDRSPGVVSGDTRDDTRGAVERPIVDDRRDSVFPVRNTDVVRPQTGSGNRGTIRDDAGHSLNDHRDAPFRSDGQRNVNDGYQSGGGVRDSVAGMKRDDPREVTPGRQVGNAQSVPTGNSREYSRDNGPVYVREEQRPVIGVASRDTVSGNTREDPHHHVVDNQRGVVVDRPRTGVEDYTRVTNVNDHRGTSSGNSRDSFSSVSRETVVGNSRDTFAINSHDTVGSNSRDNVAHNSRGTSVGNSRDAIASNPRDTYTGNSHDTVGSNSRGNVASNSHDTVAHNSRGTSVDNSRDAIASNPRDTYTGNLHDTVGSNSRGNVASNSRGTSVDNSQHTIVSNTRDTYTGNSHDTVGSNSRGNVASHSRASSVDDTRDAIVSNPRDTYTSDSRETYSGESKERFSGHSGESDRDIGLTRNPQVEHPIEEPLYISENVESLESYADHETDEEISVAHSSRPLPKTQKPRQVTAVAETRTARGPHPASPCPSVFSYEGTRAGKERWYGVVLVTTDETLTGVRLDIQLDKPAHLLGTWLGDVSSVDNIRYTIWNGRRKIQPGPPLSVKLFVKYSDKEIEPPRIRSIRLNGRQICPKDKGSSVTPVPLPQPPRNPPVRPNQPAANRPTRPATSPAQTPNRPAGNGRPTTSPAQQPSHSNFGDQSTEATELVDGVACGRIEVQASPLITYGQRTARGQWPWHAAIYQSKGTDLSFICGGSLIGRRTVLTAAHCVSRRYIDRPVDPESLVVYFGKYHLKLWSEGGVQDKQVLEVHVHPEYNSTDFQADIAILILSSPVEFTVYVKPVCLWDRNRIQLSEIEGREGVVVGWGYDERGIVTEELMMAKMPVVSQQTCIWSYPQFFSHFTSDRTFCAGFRNGTSVCNGDSGGGMVFPKTKGNGVSKPHTWVLRGIVSLSASQAQKRVCNTDHYVVFSDVAKFYDWIHKYR